LGIRKKYRTSSKPLWLDTFEECPVIEIACGSSYSLAINARGELFGWGEASLG